MLHPSSEEGSKYLLPRDYALVVLDLWASYAQFSCHIQRVSSGVIRK